MGRAFLPAEAEHGQVDIGVRHSPDQAARVNELAVDRRIGIAKRKPQVAYGDLPTLRIADTTTRHTLGVFFKCRNRQEKQDLSNL